MSEKSISLKVFIEKLPITKLWCVSFYKRTKAVHGPVVIGRMYRLWIAHEILEQTELILLLFILF